MFKIIVHKRAVRYLERISHTQKQIIKENLRKLKNNPFEYADVKPMLGDWKGYFRMRMGNKRVIFWIDKDEKIIYVDHIGPRGNIYK